MNDKARRTAVVADVDDLRGTGGGIADTRLRCRIAVGERRFCVTGGTVDRNHPGVQRTQSNAERGYASESKCKSIHKCLLRT
jgi:hypothetical protein